jgi:hypothetical protein
MSPDIQQNPHRESGWNKPQFSCRLPDGSMPAALKHAFLKSSTIDARFYATENTILLDNQWWEVYYDDVVEISHLLEIHPSVPVIISYQHWSMNGTDRRYAIIRLDNKAKDTKNATNF